MCLLVPGQPAKFQVGAVSDTSIQLTWEPAYEKEGIINYELRYKEGSFGSQVRAHFQHLRTSCKTRLRNHRPFSPPTGKEIIWTHVFLCRGGSPPKHRILLQSGCHL